MKKRVISIIRNIFDGVMIFVLFITTTVYALPSNGVIYDNSNSGSSATNVSEAIDDLYSKLTTKEAEINRLKGLGNVTSNQMLKGYTALVKGSVVTGTIPSKGAATYTPGTTNQTIASGNYLSGVQTIKGDANLVAGNIAKGKSIFGVTGSYTSDANAAAGNILSGKTAYVNGVKITGTIPSKGAATYTPGTTNQTIASGNYLSGVQTIKGDANLVAGNIAKGKSIFGVTGSYTSDANAVAGNILSGKTAYVNGVKISGSMIDRGLAQSGNWGCGSAGCGTGNDAYYAINGLPEGWYHSDGNSWAPEARINANTLRSQLGVSANKIAKGQSIAGVAGTYTGQTQFTYLTTIGYSSNWNDSKTWKASEKSVIIVIAYCNISVKVNNVAKGSSGTWAHQNAGGIFYFTMNAGETLSISGSGSGGQGAIAYRIA